MGEAIICASTAIFCDLAAAPVPSADVKACLIAKTDSNPFVMKMKEGATAKAAELGITLNGESCIADGAKGIPLAASDMKGIVTHVKKARDGGMVVIAPEWLQGLTAPACPSRPKDRAASRKPCGSCCIGLPTTSFAR